MISLWAEKIRLRPGLALLVGAFCFCRRSPYSAWRLYACFSGDTLPSVALLGFGPLPLLPCSSNSISLLESIVLFLHAFLALSILLTFIARTDFPDRLWAVASLISESNGSRLLFPPPGGISMIGLRCSLSLFVNVFVVQRIFISAYIRSGKPTTAVTQLRVPRFQNGEGNMFRPNWDSVGVCW